MKKAALFIWGLYLFFGNVALAQKTDAPEPVVPAVVTKAMKTKYAAATVTDWDWKPDKNAYEADFTMNGRDMEASFSPDGKWMKTKTEITGKELPASVTKALASGEFKTWTLNDFGVIESPDKGKMYKVEVKSGTEKYDLKYDASGNLLEKKKDKPKAKTAK